MLPSVNHLYQDLLYASHFQLAYLSRSSVFLNLPTLVRGMASIKTIASGNCHFAKSWLKNSRSSQAVAFDPSRNTTAASGRSCHFGWEFPRRKLLLPPDDPSKRSPDPRS